MAVAGAFSVDRLLSNLRTCRGDKGEIFMDAYTDAYDELGKLLELFGTVFGFVSSDVVQKVEILRAYRSSGQTENYETIQSMVSYECQNDLTVNKNKPSGCRTLLRLHRALQFITEFLEEIRKGSSEVKMACIASESYDRTLSRHHSWLIRKGVHLSFYMLPNRVQFLHRMHLEEEERAQAVLKEIVSHTRILYDDTQSVYLDNNLLDLP